VRERSLQPTPEARRPTVPEEIGLRLAVHDLSRIEWTASVGLPTVAPRKYEVEFTFEVPANIYSVHNVWDHKQSFTRLQSPSEEGELRIDRVDIDELRRDTLGVAHRLKMLREKLDRVCAAAAAQLVEALKPSLQKYLRELVEQGVSVVTEMRGCLRAPSDEPAAATAADAAPEVSREWELADEFLSHQLLDFLAASEKSIDDVLLAASSRLRELDFSWTEGLRERVAEALAAELEHREAVGFPNPHADSPKELSEFVERGSRLKKHFQGVLFLDVEAYMVDYRVRNWTGIAAASLAAGFWMAFTLLPIAPGTKAGLGLGTFTVAFAAAYALKDRVKELMRAWLAGRITRVYGQRVVTLRLPERIDRERQVMVEARERFTCTADVREDALNRTVGKTHRVMLLHYHLRGEASPSPLLERAGICSLKHIFRYDLSPIFSRLDNAVKPVPVLDPKTRRVCFADAPKEYRLPVTLCARLEGRETRVGAELVVSKRGIERLERYVEGEA
jgi:hypothetical protein